MGGNSMRDEMKDGVREILAHYYKIGSLDVDADCVCSIADVAFSVCGISENEQDQPQCIEKPAKPLRPEHPFEGDGKDLYRLQLEEINGEHEYNHDLLIKAETDSEAWEKAQQTMPCAGMAMKV